MDISLVEFLGKALKCEPERVLSGELTDQRIWLQAGFISDDFARNLTLDDRMLHLMRKFGPPLGTGACRCVFDMGDGYVFKYQHNQVMGFDNQNAFEKGLYDKYGDRAPFLLPVEHYQVDHIIGLKAPKCDPVRLINYSDEEEWIDDRFGEFSPMDCYQVGLWEGEWYMIDYGCEVGAIEDFLK